MEVKCFNDEPYVHKSSLKCLVELCSEAGARDLGAKTGEVELELTGGQTQTEQTTAGQDDGQNRKIEHGSLEPDGMYEHRRLGHYPKRVDCPTCSVASVRRRPHTRLNPLTSCDGELIVDVSGPHMCERIPKDASAEPRGRYAEHERQAALDGALARKRWFNAQGV